jgi:hypothetical protein
MGGKCWDGHTRNRMCGCGLVFLSGLRAVVNTVMNFYVNVGEFVNWFRDCYFLSRILQWN